MIQLICVIAIIIFIFGANICNTKKEADDEAEFENWKSEHHIKDL